MQNNRLMMWLKSWTRLGCSECNTEANEVILFVVVGYDSEYCYLCKDCLAKALDLFYDGFIKGDVQ